ncbi:MAG: dienelactone hydrolase [Candidatus Poriferisodalaceae bacterium]
MPLAAPLGEVGNNANRSYPEETCVTAHNLVDVHDEQKGGYRLREFTLRATFDRVVTGVLWIPDGASGAAPLVCCGHGASGDRFAAPIPWMAKQWARDHGFGVLSIDGPVHGRRASGPGGREAVWAEWQRLETVDEMLVDWKTALDFAQAQPELGVAAVGYWGLSMGTIYGAPMVAAEPRVTAAVLGLMGITGPAHYRPIIQAAAKAIDIPTLFIMQLEDELFSREICLELFDALGSADKQLHANPGSHPEVPVPQIQATIDYLARRLSL